MNEKKRGKLYGVGVGPGDKNLLTLLAVETLRRADKIVVPETGNEKTALKIVAEFVEGKELISCHMPMTRDEDILERAHSEAAALICDQLEKGFDLAFITLGDPTIYSTYIYLHRKIIEKGYEAEIINGIPSFCAAAARLNISLCDKDEALHIIPASYDHIESLLKLDGNKVLMKSGKQIDTVIDLLKKDKLISKSKMVECCCMENERLYHNLENVGTSSYFSVIIVKED